jgi:hypothetical protein
MGGNAEIIDARDHGAHRRGDCPLPDGSKVPRFGASDGIHSSFSLTALIVFVCLAVQLVKQRRASGPADGALWAGMASLHFSGVRSVGLAADFKSRTGDCAS